MFNDDFIEDKLTSLEEKCSKNINNALLHLHAVEPNKYHLVDLGEYMFIDMLGDKYIPTTYGIGLKKKISINYQISVDLYSYVLDFSFKENKGRLSVQVNPQAIADIDEKEMINFVFQSFAHQFTDMTGIPFHTSLEIIREVYAGLFKINVENNGNVYMSTNNANYKGHEISQATKQLPGMDAKVYCPCQFEDWVCDFKKTATKIWYIVQHLNDDAKWTRDKVADWLDELHDTGQVNLEFQSWGEEPKPESENPCADVVNPPLSSLEGWTNVGYTDLGDGTGSIGPFSIAPVSGIPFSQEELDKLNNTASDIAKSFSEIAKETKKVEFSWQTLLNKLENKYDKD